jgi:hypothetical protein
MSRIGRAQNQNSTNLLDAPHFWHRLIHSELSMYDFSSSSTNFNSVFSFSRGAPIWDGIGKLFKESTAESPCVCVCLFPARVGHVTQTLFSRTIVGKRGKFAGGGQHTRLVFIFWVVFFFLQHPKGSLKKKVTKTSLFLGTFIFQDLLFRFLCVLTLYKLRKLLLHIFCYGQSRFSPSESDTSRRFCTVECTWKWKGKWKI